MLVLFVTYSSKIAVTYIISIYVVLDITSYQRLPFDRHNYTVICIFNFANACSVCTICVAIERDVRNRHVGRERLI